MTPDVSVIGAQALLVALQSECDYMVVDLPPMTHWSRRMVSPTFDGFILVAGWGRTRAEGALNSLARTGLDDTKFVGTA